MSANVNATDGGLVAVPQTGAREDLLDIMSVIDAKQTPFLSMVSRGKKPRASEVEWHADAYADPREDAIVDGTDVDATDYENHAANRAKISMYLHQQRRTARIGRVASRISDVAGIKDELSNSLEKKTTELRRDMERVMLSDNECVLGTTSVAAETRGLGKWVQSGAQAVLPVPAAYRTPAAQNITTAMASFAESDIQDLTQAIWDETGGSANLMTFCGSTWKRTFTDMLTSVQAAEGTTTSTPYGTQRVFNNAQGANRISNSVTILAGDFGEIQAVPCPFIGMTSTATVDKDRAYFLDMDKIKLCIGWDPTPEYYEDRGGGPRFMLEVLYLLSVTNPLGMGKHIPA